MIADVSSKELTVQCLAGLAIVAAGQGQAQRAFSLAAAGAHLGTWTIQAAYPIGAVDLDRALTLAREELGEADIAAAVAEGRAMTLEEAVAYALADAETGTRARR
jgi:hypothetical protein